MNEIEQKAYDDGFEDGKKDYWIPNEWIGGPYADFYWDGYDAALALYFAEDR